MAISGTSFSCGMANPYDLEQVEAAQRELAGILTRMLDGTMSFIEGARSVWRLAKLASLPRHSIGTLLKLPRPRSGRERGSGFVLTFTHVRARAATRRAARPIDSPASGRISS